MALPVDPQPTKPASGTLADAAEIKSKFDAIYAYITGGQAEADFLKSGAGLFDSYKPILHASGLFTVGNVNAGHYWLVENGAIQSGSAAAACPRLISFDDADFLVSTKTLKLRVRAVLATNPTAPTGTFKVGLYPVSSVGGTGGVIAFNLGSVVAGSTVTFASPGASSVNQGNSGDFTIPADGVYLLGCELSNQPVGNSATAVSAQLQVRAV